MRAAFLTSFGEPSAVISVGDVDEPLVGPDCILIDVAAAGVNPVDFKIVQGYLQGAFPHHLPLIPGWDVAGTVAAVGPAVTSVAVGDRVAAYARKDDVQWGTFAQRVSVSDRAVARVPDGVPDDQAGALPLAGLTAAQVLDAADVRSGDIVLVHAAAGGVGTFAAQLARLRGATVVGTASTRNHDVLAAWGVLPVDYSHHLVEGVRRHAPDGVDVVIDLVGGEALAATPQLLKPGGRLAGIVDAAGIAQLAQTHGYLGRYVFVRPDGAMLTHLLGLVADGLLRVDVSEHFDLADTAAALETLMSGHTRGKVVITVG